jgi:acetyl-CoA carboxylase biotin carboxyl carrier protein
VLTFDQIKELIELVSSRRLQGFELERSGFRLKIEGQPATPRAALDAGIETHSAAGAPRPAAPEARGESAAEGGRAPGGTAAAAGGHLADSHILTSPIVGTFYRAPSPDAEPFTEVGARVRRGQVLCIIEAMKLMNEIESDIDGVVVEIYPQNAQAVEFGEPLFAIRPS